MQPGKLGGALPVIIEGDEATWEETAEQLDDIFLGDAEVRRRSFLPDAGPRGGDAPVITPEGHQVLDIQFYEGLKLYGGDTEYTEIAAEIEKVPGVVTHGLIAGGSAFGSVVVVIASAEGPPKLVSLNGA
jgi:ribose 5-phosphate isomerase A